MSQNLSSVACPKCGASSAGKFCHACGAATRERVCSKCQAPLSPGAHFCHACGSSQESEPRQSGSSRLPWAIAGAAVVVSVLVLAIGGGSAGPSDPGSTPTAPSPLGAPDISSMSPREQADGLFEVVMVALERGDTAQVGFHAPMALGAYRNLGSLDADAQYHVGLLRGALGDNEGMLAMADSLQAVVPGHLLATTLRKAAAEARGDSAGVLSAYRQFLMDYGDEASVSRQEYLLHRRSIDAFLAEANRATAGEGN